MWIVYPTIRTIIRSFYDREGDTFVGVDNYETLFTDDTLLTAIRNNFLWLLVVPAFVTAIGLVFAVLLERIRFSTAFKVAVFMPMAISLFAAGVIWRLMYEKDPEQGTVNAAVSVVKDAVSPSGVLSNARPSTDALQGGPEGGFELKDAIQPGEVAQLGLTAIREDDVPEGAEQAVVPEPLSGGITGVVWRDFKPGGGTPGRARGGRARAAGRDRRAPRRGRRARSPTRRRSPTARSSSRTSSRGRIAPRSGRRPSRRPMRASRGSAPSLIVPAIMIAYIWVWAGFSMVVIAAGLAAIPRDLLEAARTDGANEWQVFRRITIPLLAPVLTVVFITMLIYVLKVFDIVIAIAPGSVEDDANVIALAMWRTSFGGSNDFGLGAAIAVFLFLLVIPVLLINVRRFRREV